MGGKRGVDKELLELLHIIDSQKQSQQLASPHFVLSISLSASAGHLKPCVKSKLKEIYLWSALGFYRKKGQLNILKQDQNWGAWKHWWPCLCSEAAARKASKFIYNLLTGMKSKENVEN